MKIEIQLPDTTDWINFFGDLKERDRVVEIQIEGQVYSVPNICSLLFDRMENLHQQHKKAKEQNTEHLQRLINIQEEEIKRLNQEIEVVPKSHSAMCREKLVVCTAKIQAFEKVLKSLS